MLRCFFTVVLLLGLVGSSRAAWAGSQSDRVVLVGLRAADPLAEQLVVELRALGFRVLIEDALVAGDTLGQLELRAQELDVAAAIRVTRSETTRLEIWVLDRVTDKLVRRVLDTAGADWTPRVVALRTIELLRASLRELTAPEAPPEHRAEVSRPVASLIRPPPAAGHVALGGAALASPGGVGETLEVWISASTFSGERWGLAAQAMLPVRGASVRGAEGVADIAPFVFGAGPMLRLGPGDAVWRLLLGAGLGAAVLRMEGFARDPYESRRDWATAPLAFATARFALGIGRGLSLGTGVWFAAAYPELSVEFAGREVAKWGLPIGAGVIEIGLDLE